MTTALVTASGAPIGGSIFPASDYSNLGPEIHKPDGAVGFSHNLKRASMGLLKTFRGALKERAAIEADKGLNAHGKAERFQPHRDRVAERVQAFPWAESRELRSKVLPHEWNRLLERTWPTELPQILRLQHELNSLMRLRPEALTDAVVSGDETVLRLLAQTPALDRRTLRATLVLPQSLGSFDDVLRKGLDLIPATATAARELREYEQSAGEALTIASQIAAKVQFAEWHEDGMSRDVTAAANFMRKAGLPPEAA